VIAAAFNEEAHIGRLVASLQEQSLEPQEIIVVDDGSRDRTASLAKESGARVVSVRHRGPARARNLGAEMSTGDILVFVDGDMYCYPGFVEALVLPIHRGEAVGTFSKEIFVGNPENRWAHAYARIRRLAFPRLLPEDFPDRWANYRAVDRKAFLAAGGYEDVGYGEDMTLAPKLGRLAHAAPGAKCVHFNPATPREIFENGRWIGRGHDIAEVAHPWLDSLAPRALLKGLLEARTTPGLVMIPARLAYHLGLTVGLIQRKFFPDRHWK
jgi:glycosyltransferase involved in cell wall biosynthesis